MFDTQIEMLAGMEPPDVVFAGVIVTAGELGNSTGENPTKLTLKNKYGAKGKIVGHEGETAANVAYVVKAQEGESFFMGYIADYEQGSTVGTMIGTDAHYCFTANMNGCTFGLGSQALPTSPVLVSHGNAANPKSNVYSNIPKKLKEKADRTDEGKALVRALQTKLQFKRGAKMHPGGVLFQPEHYRGEGANTWDCTTMVYRPTGGKWKIYMQRYHRRGGVTAEPVAEAGLTQVEVRSKCYITTATCQSRGLPDDCTELTTLRWFRDTIVSQTPAGLYDIAQYYETAPLIVAKINRRPDSVQIYDWIYHQRLRPAVVAIQRGEFREAHTRFRTMVAELQERFS